MQPLKISLDPLQAMGDWQIGTPFREKLTIEGIDIFLCGMQAHHPQFGEVVGSAANSGNFPTNQAWYELVERISILESSQKNSFILRSEKGFRTLGQADFADIFPQPKNKSSEFQYSKSNGVALFSTWEEACRRACFELVERHLVLASWTGLTRPHIVPSPQSSFLKKLNGCYDLVHINFGSQRVSCFHESVFAGGVALLPKRQDIPLIVAFGASFSLEEALTKAESECLQRLGFLWGEEIPDREPDFQASALYHQEYFLYPGVRGQIETWLAGGFVAPNRQGLPELLSMSFADLSYFSSLGLYVAKALAPEAIPLVFGKWREREFDMLPEERLIHPVA